MKAELEKAAGTEDPGRGPGKEKMVHWDEGNLLLPGFLAAFLLPRP